MKVAATLIMHNGKFLLVRTGRKPWELCGGYVLDEESYDNAAVRTTFDETGLIIRTSKLVSCYFSKQGKEQVIKKIFLAEVVGGKLKLDNGWEMKSFFSHELEEANLDPEAKQCIQSVVHGKFGQTYYPDGEA